MRYIIEKCKEILHSKKVMGIKINFIKQLIRV